MNNGFFPGYRLCTCSNCHNKSVWNDTEERCVDPVIGGGPRPHVEMPRDVKTDLEEARRISVNHRVEPVRCCGSASRSSA